MDHIYSAISPTHWHSLLPIVCCSKNCNEYFYIRASLHCKVNSQDRVKVPFQMNLLQQKCESNLWKNVNHRQKQVWEMRILHWALCELRPGWKEAER